VRALVPHCVLCRLVFYFSCKRMESLFYIYIRNTIRIILVERYTVKNNIYYIIISFASINFFCIMALYIYIYILISFSFSFLSNEYDIYNLCLKYRDNCTTSLLGMS